MNPPKGSNQKKPGEPPGVGYWRPVYGYGMWWGGYGVGWVPGYWVVGYWVPVLGTGYLASRVLYLASRVLYWPYWLYTGLTGSILALLALYWPY